LSKELETILPVSDLRLPRLLAQSQTLERLRKWCRLALASDHLVRVASHLDSRLGADQKDLEALGIPIDLLRLFPDWRHRSPNGFRPPSLGFRPPPAGAAEPMGTLRLQLSPAPGTIPYAFRLLRDLLRRTDASDRIVLVVEPGANLQALRRLVREHFSKTAAHRVGFAELRAVSVFAQDNARPARDSRDRRVLLIPRTFGLGSSREGDQLTPDEAEQAFGVPVVRTRMVWQGGNIVHDNEHCLVGVDTVVENMARFGLTAGETIALLSADLGVEIELVGDMSRARFDRAKETMTVSGQAAFHIDLDVALLGRFGRHQKPFALVADSVRGLDLLPAVLARQPLFSGGFLPASNAKAYIRAEYEAYAKRRYRLLLNYASALERLGYHIVGMPDLRIDPDQNVFASTNLDFGYCNVLPGLRRSRPAVYYLPWGIPALDRAAASRFRAAGLEPVRIGTPAVANALMRLEGGLRCCCGRLL
jgi:hypothetical protein